MNKNQTEFYRVRLIEYAIPAFCDGEALYYDTADNIRRLFERSLKGKGKESAECYLAAMDEYLSGRGPGRVQLQYESPSPLISPVRFLGKHTWESGPQAYKFYNAWQWEHDIVIDGVQTEAVYLEDAALLPEYQLMRCVKLQMKAPREVFEDGQTALSYLNSMRWGYPYMIIQKNPDILTNSLYYPDHFFQTAEEVQADMENPCLVDFRRFFLEIHGDG